MRLTEHGYSGIDNGTKVQNFSQGMRSTKLEEVVNVVQTQSAKYGKNFAAVLSYLGQIATKNNYNMKSVQTAKTRSYPTEPKVAPFMGKIECKICPKAVWNSLLR